MVISISILENVEHCGGEPERADRNITDEWMSDVTSSNFDSVQVDTITIQLHADGSTEHDRLLTMYASCIKPSLACLTPVHSDHLPSCSLWRRRSSSPFLSLQTLQTPRGNLSLAISRFISVELHGEESFVAENIKKALARVQN